MISPKNGWRMFFSETCDNNYRTPTLVHICIYVYMYIGIYAYMFICLYVYMYYTCIYVYVYICIYVYMSICLYVCIYIYVYIYIYIHVSYVHWSFPSFSNHFPVRNSLGSQATHCEWSCRFLMSSAFKASA